MPLSPSISDGKQQLRALMQQARWEEALAASQRICDAAPRDIEAWILKAAISSEMGDFQQAVHSCREALQLQPRIARVHYNLGVALQMLGLHVEAAESYRNAIEIEPTHASSRANLALALRSIGELEEAITQVKAAIAQQPGLAEAHDTLGLALMDLNRHDEAAESFAQTIRLAPDFPDGHAHLGLCLEGQGSTAQAMVSYRRATDLDPFHAEALSRVGCLLSLQGKHRDAIDWLRRAVDANPVDFNALVSLGNALMRVGSYYRHYPEAEQCLRRAMDIRPSDATCYIGLANVLQNRGLYQEAIDCLERFSATDPQHTEAIALTAQLLERLGQVQRSRQILQSMLERGVEHVQLDLAFARVVRHVDHGAEAIARLETQIMKTDLQAEVRRDVHYALGKLYDETNEYDLAFEHYRAANRLNPDSLNELKHQEMFDAVTKVYTRESVKLRPLASNRSKLPVFIVGMPRSGTSLVEQILASHPRVYGGGELNHIPDLADTMQEMLGVEITYPYLVDMLTKCTLDQVAQSHLHVLSKLGRKAWRVTDKMPHNFRWLGLIDQLFPGAQVIHCRRDPMDNCLSIYFQKFNMHHTYSSDLGALGRYYRRYQALMAHWRNVLRLPILDLCYEDLVADQEGMTRRLIEFCGLDWDDNCLHFHESGRLVTTPSYDQVRKPIYRNSVARWKNYEKHLQSLKEALEFDGSFESRQNTS